MRIARLSLVVMALAVGLSLAAVTSSVGQTPDDIANQMGPEQGLQGVADQAAAEQAAAEQAAAEQAAADRAAAEQAARQAAADRAAAEGAAAERVAAEEAARQAAADRAAAEEAERRAAADRAAVEETAPSGDGTAANEVAPETIPTGPGPAANTVTEGPGDTVAENDRNGPQQEARWPVPLLIGAGAMLALVLAGLMLKRILSPKPEIDPDLACEPEPAETAPPATPPPLIRPSLDPGEGGVAGDEIEAAGPDVRLGATLEPGATLFDGNEPEVRDE